MSDNHQPSVRPGFKWSLVAVVIGVLLFVAGVQVFGGKMGAPCVDSYSCEGFLIGGAECVEVDSGRYCTIYCDDDAECPTDWRCLGANPTAMTIETDLVDEVCVRTP